MASRLQPCDTATADGRLSKAKQFLEAATVLRDASDNETDVGDAFVTLCVHAGIASSDVLCCRALGHHVQGDNHNEAIAELRKVDKDLARDLLGQHRPQAGRRSPDLECRASGLGASRVRSDSPVLQHARSGTKSLRRRYATQAEKYLQST